MAVQYDSENNNWKTWIDLFKNKFPEASNEAKKALDDIQKNLSKGFILDSRINMTRLEPPLRVLHIFQLAC